LGQFNREEEGGLYDAKDVDLHWEGACLLFCEYAKNLIHRKRN